MLLDTANVCAVYDCSTFFILITYFILINRRIHFPDKEQPEFSNSSVSYQPETEFFKVNDQRK